MNIHRGNFYIFMKFLLLHFFRKWEGGVNILTFFCIIYFVQFLVVVDICNIDIFKKFLGFNILYIFFMFMRWKYKLL